MKIELENVVQTEDGLRKVREADFQGAHIRIATGYDPRIDAWPFHIYVQRNNERVVRRSDLPTLHVGHSMEDAFQRGFEAAVQYVEPKGNLFRRSRR